MKRFMYLSIALMCLTVTALLISSNVETRIAQAQEPPEAEKTSPIVGFTADGTGAILFVITENGDVFYQETKRGNHIPINMGNFWKSDFPINR